MPATYFLATDDPDLLRAWWVLVPAGRQVITLADWGTVVLAPGIPTIVVVDVLVQDRLPAPLRGAPTIVVGEPGSAALERVRAAGTARLLLSYDESRGRLGSLLPLLEEIADGAAALRAAEETMRKGVSAPVRLPSPDRQDSWHELDPVLEKLGSADGVVDEVRRLFRSQLHVSTVHYFRRGGGGFHALDTDFECASTDPLCGLWSRQPVVIDGAEWPVGLNPGDQVAILQRMNQWGARLLVPVHENGALRGFFSVGVRDDGTPFSARDRETAVALARLFRRLSGHSERLHALTEQNERWRLAEHYLPNVLLLGADDAIPKHLPAAVRTLIMDARASGDARTLVPGPDQPFRGRAGRVAGSDGVWVHWEDASADVRDLLQRQRSDRLALLHDLALTLNHELGNALVSLAALRHRPGAETSSPVLLAAIQRDIANLEAMNRHLASIPTFSEAAPEEADVRVLLRNVAQRAGVQLEPTGPSVMLAVVPKLLEFALEWIIESVAENRPELGKRDLTLRLRAGGTGDQLTAQISIKGPKLALEGVLPAPGPDDVPSHGRVSVFIAKEIIRLHGGELRANQTTLGSEILIAVRNW